MILQCLKSKIMPKIKKHFKKFNKPIDKLKKINYNIGTLKSVIAKGGKTSGR